jgi:hypothetical protein
VTVKKKKPRPIRSHIAKALVAARMEDADFADSSGTVPLPKSEADVNDFIRARTENYRQTRIIRTLENALRGLDAAREVREEDE